MITALKKNKFTQTLATGAAALGVIAGSMLVATSANATNVFHPWPQWAGGDPLTTPNNTATYIFHNLPGNFDPLNTIVELVDSGDEDSFIFDPIGYAYNGAGYLTYSIDITEPGKFFSGVAIDSDVTATGYGNVYKDVCSFVPGDDICEQTDSNFLLRLDSSDGAPQPFPDGFTSIPNSYTKLLITDTFAPHTPGGVEGVFSASNDFQESTSIPEPGTVLGLLALGGLGLGLKRKKQD